MDEEIFGTKELYDVCLKTTYPMEIGGIQFSQNETIIEFEKIQMMSTQTLTRTFSAKGGYIGETLVNWQNVSEIEFQFSQGVCSFEQLAILSNARLVNKADNSILIDNKEIVQNENNLLTLSQVPTSESVFIYNKDTGEKILDFSINENIITLDNKYSNIIDILVRYQYYYKNKSQVLQVGKQLTSGFLSLTGRMSLKDDNSGRVVTGIITIPKLKLMSDLSIRLGQNLSPMMTNFYGVGYPVGDRENKTVCEIIKLNDNIDSDI